MKAILVHGTYGFPENNWFPWLKNELQKIGYEVIIPKFPTPQEQNLAQWMQVLEPHFKEFDEQTILIGHSLGCAFLLSVLEKLEKPVKAVFLVAGFIKQLGNPKFDPINKTFLQKNFDFKKIKDNSEYFFVYGSENDEYVPTEQVLRLAKSLETSVISIPEAGHFMSKSFSQLLSDVEEIEKKI